MKKKYPLVQINFKDHCKTEGGHSEVVDCVVFGILYKETKTAFHICTWISDGVIVGPNNEGFTVLKHKGIKKTVIKEITLELHEQLP